MVANQLECVKMISIFVVFSQRELKRLEFEVEILAISNSVTDVYSLNLDSDHNEGPATYHFDLRPLELVMAVMSGEAMNNCAYT